MSHKSITLIEKIQDAGTAAKSFLVGGAETDLRTTMGVLSKEESETLVGSVASAKAFSTYSPSVQGVLDITDLSEWGVGSLGPYTYGAGVLTATVHANIGGPVGTRVLVRLFTGDGKYSGIYEVSDAGAPDSDEFTPDGHPPSLTRAADFNASEDFIDGTAFLIQDGGVHKLYRLGVPGVFLLDTDFIKFDLLDPEYNTREGLKSLLSGRAVNTALVSDGAGGIAEIVPALAATFGAVTATGATASAALGVLPLPPFVIPLTGYATTTGLLTAIALVTFDPTIYAITGKTATLTLETTGSVSAGGLVGVVTLQNLTDVTTDATIQIVSTSTLTQTAVVASNIALLASTKIYELRVALTGTGYVALGACLRITWS